MKRLLKGIENGLPLKHAAMLAGVSYDTLNRWRKQGEEEDAGDEFRDFCKALERSQAIAMLGLVSKIRRAGKSDWKAAAWLLERRHPEEYGRSSNEEIHKIKHKPLIEQNPVTHDVLQRMQKQTKLANLVGKLGAELMKVRSKRLAREDAEKNMISHSMSKKRMNTPSPA